MKNKMGLCLLSFGLLVCGQVYAVCPLCVVAVGAGLGLAHWLGIDDTITGLWFGALLVALIAWTVVWLNKKNIHFKGRIILITVLYYACTILPLYPAGIMGHPLHTLWGIDKLLLGIIIGSITFFSFMMWYFHMKKNNNGHAYFPFQKVVMPIVPLVVLSVLFHYILWYAY